MFALRKSLAAAAAITVTLLFAGPGRCLASSPGTDIQVDVGRHGDAFTVHAQLSVPVPAKLAFAVMTDYDHMHQFLPGLTASKIIERAPGRLLVAQAGGVPIGPLSLPFHYVRRVDLQPDSKLVSHVISGSVKKADVTTTLAESGGQTSITYESEATTGIWMPFGISTSVIAGHVRAQLDSMRDEMLRRQTASQAAK